jgi:hypothetical protein
MLTVSSSNQYFVYDTGAYFIDQDLIREDVQSKMNVLYYHQGSSLPMKIDIDVSKLMEELKENNSAIEKSVNPTSLKDFVTSDIIQKILKGAEMMKELSQIKMLVILNTVVVST